LTGKIIGICGATVRVVMKGLKLSDRVVVGNDMLAGEVVRLEKDSAVVQVYEDTRGLGIGEVVKNYGKPLSVTLGPGLLENMFDGMQQPLEVLRDDGGPFLRRGKEYASLDFSAPRLFHPVKEKGDRVGRGEILGHVEEGPVTHYVLSSKEGVLDWITDGAVSLDEPAARLDDGTDLFACQEWPVRVPRPFRRKLPPVTPLLTGQRVIDFLYPVARGGTAVIPGGFGTGKTILEQSIAKFAEVDIVVYVGCGERGNEMAELIGDFEKLENPWTGGRLMERTILVVNTSNMPVAARESSIYTAVTMAEYYRDMGYHVLMLADSISRWAEALREISSSLEEMPGEEGYPTYLASRLSGFYERAGLVETLSGKIGSLTMILSVSPPGGDFTEPVTQACLRVAGAFLMLDTSLAHRRHFPAINWSQSYSLYAKDISRHMEELHSQWGHLKRKCLEVLDAESSLKEITELVGYEGLQDSDRLVMKVAELIRTGFLAQNSYTDDAFSPPERTVSLIDRIVGFYEDALGRLQGGEPFDEVMKSAPGQFPKT
jgi:V/A-type H+-transporting ATPase subunit A